jgi:hypothetical protein
LVSFFGSKVPFPSSIGGVLSLGQKKKVRDFSEDKDKFHISSWQDCLISKSPHTKKFLKSIS